MLILGTVNVQCVRGMTNIVLSSMKCKNDIVDYIGYTNNTRNVLDPSNMVL